MLATRDRLLAEARTEIKQAALETVGYGFLRLHVIDMEGPMDLEAGYFTAGHVQRYTAGSGAGTMPAGRYATLSYKIMPEGQRRVARLGPANGLTLDRWTVPEGDAFACRYEAFWTDPKVEPHKTKWTVELSMRPSRIGPAPRAQLYVSEG